MDNYKFLIYGTPNGEPTYKEQILYTKCQTVDECQKVIEIIKQKSGNAYYNYRIVDTSTFANTSITQLFINAIK